MNDDDAYLVWSDEHRAWWKPGARGYTTRIAEAGRFSRHEALTICADALPNALRNGGHFSELPVRLVDVRHMIERSDYVDWFVRGEK